MRYKITHRDKKYCPKCDRTLSTDLFYKEAGRHDGLNAYCKECKTAVNKAWREANPDKAKKSQQATRRKLEYGITQEDFDRILVAQNSLCPLCNMEVGQSSHVDHDHKTGKVRGILCSTCNTGLGMFKDDINIFKNAIKYLVD